MKKINTEEMFGDKEKPKIWVTVCHYDKIQKKRETSFKIIKSKPENLGQIFSNNFQRNKVKSLVMNLYIFHPQRLPF